MPAARRIFVIVPSATLSSPMKGAAALANALSRERDVTLVALKTPLGGFDLLADAVRRVALSEAGGWPARFMALRRLLRDAGGRPSVAAISLCLSADIATSRCRDLAVTCSSVRGNIVKVYPETYGAAGRWIAHRHLGLLRRFDHVVSMTRAMAAQVERHTGKPSAVIGNFVDEAALTPFRQQRPAGDALRFVFTGSMIRGKQPHLLIDAMAQLQARGVAARLDMVGDGPLRPELEARSRSLTCSEAVVFHGHVSVPYGIVAAADALVLPSLTEGMSRSALEALFLGVPCVLRDVDGNSELLHGDDSGSLFHRDQDLAEVMVEVARRSRHAADKPNLLPASMRQSSSAARYRELVEGG